jgi:hypothetical protein
MQPSLMVRVGMPPATVAASLRLSAKVHAIRRIALHETARGRRARPTTCGTGEIPSSWLRPSIGAFAGIAQPIFDPDFLALLARTKWANGIGTFVSSALKAWRASRQTLGNPSAVSYPLSIAYA